jgi:hypothetical protein
MIKVISGGQTGADIAGVKAAKELGIPTGGWMPQGWITGEGTHPEYGDLYGMREHPRGYPDRTFQNVVDSHCTIRFAKNWHSPGERCTLKALKQFLRPHLDIDIENPLPHQDVYDWLLREMRKNGSDPFIINIAGNAESTAPGTFWFTYSYLEKLFSRFA